MVNNTTATHLRKSIFVLAVLSTGAFLVTCFFGEGLGGGLGSNLVCLSYLGCTSGFFGYDAVEHFLFGVSAIWILLWIFIRFPFTSLLCSIRWKNYVILLVLIIGVAVIWEFVECAHDAFRLDILHQPLRDVRFHVNLLDQPSNLDTMGDLFFSIVGSLVSFLFVERWFKSVIRKCA